MAENITVTEPEMTGRPSDGAYLEKNLPSFLELSLTRYKEGSERKKRGEEVSLLDCYYCELQSDINSSEVNGIISSRQAWYLREKYLGLEKET